MLLHDSFLGSSRIFPFDDFENGETQLSVDISGQNKQEQIKLELKIKMSGGSLYDGSSDLTSNEQNVNGDESNEQSYLSSEEEDTVEDPPPRGKRIE